MRPKDRELAAQIEAALRSFDRDERPLSGIRDAARLDCLLEQIVESIHRVRYVSLIRERRLSDLRSDPTSELFDPLKAAVLHQERGNIEEAFWLVFLFVHFGKNRSGGWRYAREIYGRLGERPYWDWSRTSADPASFRRWLADHQQVLSRPGGGFGNHRKFESLSALSPNGTGAVVAGYVNWVHPPRTHQAVMAEARVSAGGDSRRAFDHLYRSMNAVTRFGRLARFDYLTMVGKMGLALIEPGSTYMQGATGPFAGACLLFGVGQNTSRRDLDRWLVDLDAKTHLGMQVLEDALCNWEKSPQRFIPFRG